MFMTTAQNLDRKVAGIDSILFVHLGKHVVTPLEHSLFCDILAGGPFR